MAFNVADSLPEGANGGGVDKVRGQELVWDRANGCCLKDEHGWCFNGNFYHN